MHYVCAAVYGGQENSGSPEAGVTGGCKVLFVFLEPNPGSLQERPVLFLGLKGFCKYIKLLCFALLCFSFFKKAQCILTIKSNFHVCM